MAGSAILDQLQELAGFPVIPGTLNVRVPEPFNPPTAIHLAAEVIDPGLEAETGQSGYSFTQVMIAGHYRGLAMQADEPGYPEDQVELICEVHLRQTLDLVDGSQIAFSLLDT